MLSNCLKTAAAALLAVGLGATSAVADSHEGCDVDATGMPVDAKVSGSVKSIGLLVSARWGNGVLSLANGSRHRFHVVGAKALETGAARNDFIGEVYNLQNVNDFAGTYWGASSSIKIGTLGKGEGVVNNANCVIIKFRLSGNGLKVSGPAPGGVEVSFID